MRFSSVQPPSRRQHPVSVGVCVEESERDGDGEQGEGECLLKEPVGGCRHEEVCG